MEKKWVGNLGRNQGSSSKNYYPSCGGFTKRKKANIKARRI